MGSFRASWHKSSLILLLDGALDGAFDDVMTIFADDI